MTTDSVIERDLQQFAELGRFWIFRNSEIQPGLVEYADSDGRAWVMMDDDSTRVDACIRFLEARGCPVFGDANEVLAHVASLAQTDPQE